MVTMRRRRIALLTVSGLLAAAATAVAEQKSQSWPSTPRGWYEDAAVPPASDPARWFSASDGALDLSHVGDVIERTVGRCRDSAPARGGTVMRALRSCQRGDRPTFPGPDEYVLVHVVRLKIHRTGDETLEIDREHWYVANGGAAWDDAATSGSRLFGSRNVYLLYVFLGAPAAAYDVVYRIVDVKKAPAYLTHLSALLELYSGRQAVVAERLQQQKLIARFDFTRIDVPYVPSDLEVTATIVPSAGPANGVDSRRQIFDNEARYHVDFSVGYPVRKARDVVWAQTDSSLAPANASKANLLGLFDYYPRAFDVKTHPYSWTPHAVIGVGLSQQPLHEILVAAGAGPIVAHFYAGVLLNTVRLQPGARCGDLPVTTATTTTLARRTCPEFSVGLNVAVGAIADALRHGAAK